MTRPLSILTVNTSDRAGGAERIAWLLYQGYRQRGHHSALAVGVKTTTDPNVIEIGSPPERPPWASTMFQLRDWLAPHAGRAHKLSRAVFWLDALGRGRRDFEQKLGLESFHFPISRRLLQLLPLPPDVLHLHNLHGNYFDLRVLPDLGRAAPIIITMHDAWLLSGHCAHSLDCTRWRTGCGHCPDLTLPPTVPRDLTAWNWQRKKNIFARSQLFVATPSRGLMNKVEQSILRPAIVQARVIPYGIDLHLFYPADKQRARAALGLEPDKIFLLASGNRVKHNRWKDYASMRRAVEIVTAQRPEQPLVFLLLGQPGASEWIGQTEIRPVGIEQDLTRIAQYYQASDVFLHAAHWDTFPNTVLEAMACGAPVVASAVGGIPEQVRDGETGFLVPHQDAEQMAARVRALLDNPEQAAAFGQEAVQVAQREYDLARQTNDYLEWMQEIVASRSRSQTSAARPPLQSSDLRTSNG